MSPLSLSKDKIRVLLLEGIHPNAVRVFADHGYAAVESLPHAPDAETLKRLIADVHIVGIRSRTRLSADVLGAAHRLFCVGCFCIGTNQVDLAAARGAAIPVFNAPYSNTRSVAEMVMGEIIMLLRRTFEKSTQAHAGVWRKTATGAHETRGKVLGIVGYGHIGSQLSVLAESLGMRVCYHDIVEKLPLGNAVACRSLGELLSAADLVTLHVPATPETRDLIGAREIAAMKPGSLLINAARGNVVRIPALVEALKSGHLAGAAIDVHPEEPASGDEEFVSPLRGLANVILTPHVGGSTLEAQANIGIEVADKLVRYSDNGSTQGAVNFPEVALPVQGRVTRFMHIHRNEPGVLSRINAVFASRGLNIAGQYLRTDGEIGYVVVDVDGELEDDANLRRNLETIDGTMRVRFLV
ncbi:MAG: phosphoglycerate dehydrogenase [Alphaproteobacteria bacterium]